VTLHDNLVNCPNNGIIIGADNVTVDLNYHTIDGDGTPAAGCDPATEFCDTGVANFGNNGVTVIHGSLRQFAAGVDFGEVRNNRLLDISASNNKGIGIQLFNSSRSLIQSSSGAGTSVRHEGTGLGLFDCNRVRVLDNSFRQNGEVGVQVNDSSDNLIKRNRVSHNGGEGLLMGHGERNRIKRNRVVRNGAGITLGPGSHNVIKRNHVFRGRDGIRIEQGRGNLVADNTVRHARRAGIRLGIPHPFLGGAHNTVRGNVVNDTRVDGFLVNAKDDHSLLKGNTAKGAGDDGFDVESHSATLTRNEADRNGDLGIDAVRGVNDGGGNRARGNGDPRQCINIACTDP
jgi:parallel beta-helix repeat protein